MKGSLALALSFVFFLHQALSSLLSKSTRGSDDEALGTQSFSGNLNFLSSGSSKADAALIAFKKPSASLAQVDPNIINTGTCICVTSGSCGVSSGSSDGTGTLDIRIINGQPASQPSSSGSSVFPVSTGIPPVYVNQFSCQSGLSLCCNGNANSCGQTYPPIAGAATPSASQAPYGSYPWQAVLLSPGSVYQGSGALIDQLNVVTAAHKVTQYQTNGIQLKVRLGEWDASASNEPISAQEFIVTRIFVHPQFNSANLRNDIAILRLSSAVPLGQTPTIATVCLPSNQISGQRCWVAGWGRNDFTTGSFQAIMKQVDVPLVDQATCQSQLRATRLGSNFVLDTISFMCAGGEFGKDACTGDGGSPLVCQNGGRWYIMGIVAWGIGCGTSNVPGVYVNIPSYLSWIQSAVQS